MDIALDTMLMCTYIYYAYIGNRDEFLGGIRPRGFPNASNVVCVCVVRMQVETIAPPTAVE